MTPLRIRPIASTILLLQLLAISAVAEIRLVGKNGVVAAVSGIKRADASGLLVQMEEGGTLQKLPWHFVDLKSLQATYPTIFTAYRRAKEGGITDLDLGTCKGLRLADAYPFDKDSGFEKLENVSWMDNSYSDGDSFYAFHEGKRYIFRLYHVDTAEDNDDYPDRVKEQQDYFGVTKARLKELAEEATTTTRSLVAKPFTVFTKWDDARGNSQIPRHYAYILLPDGRMLSEHLVSAGMARIYGMSSGAPDGMKSTPWREHLQKLEAKAKAEEKGGWSKPTDDE